MYSWNLFYCHYVTFIRSSDGNVCICKGAFELLVFGESFLPRENVSGLAVSSEYNLRSPLAN